MEILSAISNDKNIYLNDSLNNYLKEIVNIKIEEKNYKDILIIEKIYFSGSVHYCPVIRGINEDTIYKYSLKYILNKYKSLENFFDKKRLTSGFFKKKTETDREFFENNFNYTEIMNYIYSKIGTEINISEGLQYDHPQTNTIQENDDTTSIALNGLCFGIGMGIGTLI